jgi:hypothetical protein
MFMQLIPCSCNNIRARQLIRGELHLDISSSAGSEGCKVCLYIFCCLSVSTKDGEGPGSCGSGAFTAEEANGVVGKDQQMTQHFVIFGIHYNNLMGSIAR